MANSDIFKRLWRKYTELQTWAGEDPESKKFTSESTSFLDPATTPSSASNNRGATSTAQVKYISIIGLIYPSTQPFRQRALRVEIRVPETYPQEPPEVYMRMKIRHPNIEKDGE
jgi:ubiquitin-protein ligase